MPPTSHPPELVGRTLAGLRLTGAIDGGTFRAVTLDDPAQERVVRVLVPSPDDAELTRLRREAEPIVALDDAGIVRFHGFSAEDGVVLAVWESAAGARLGSGPTDQVVAWMRAAAEALAAAHAGAVAHRRLGPEHIVLCGGVPRITGFGEALFLGDAACDGGFRGSPDADVCALGRIARTLLAAPGGGELRPDVPDAVAEAIARATRREPERRFADAAELVRALDALPSDDVPRRVARVTRGGRPRPEAPLPIATIAAGIGLVVVTLLGAAVAGALWFFAGRSPDRIVFDEDVVTVHALDPIDLQVATAVDEDNRPVDAELSWSVEPAWVATIDGSRIVPIHNGEATISVSAGGARGRYTLWIAAPERVEIVAPLRLGIGESARLDARVMAGGERIAAVPAWASSDTSILTVDSDGWATARAPGRADVTATAMGLSATSAIEVEAGDTGVVE